MYCLNPCDLLLVIPVTNLCGNIPVLFETVWLAVSDCCAQCYGSGMFYPGSRSDDFLIPEPTWKLECKLTFVLLLMLSGAKSFCLNLCAVWLTWVAMYCLNPFICCYLWLYCLTNLCGNVPVPVLIETVWLAFNDCCTLTNLCGNVLLEPV
jgi:hypothetical protein